MTLSVEGTEAARQTPGFYRQPQTSVNHLAKPFHFAERDLGDLLQRRSANRPSVHLRVLRHRLRQAVDLKGRQQVAYDWPGRNLHEPFSSAHQAPAILDFSLTVFRLAVRRCQRLNRPPN
jgi:hypothetical protein